MLPLEQDGRRIFCLRDRSDPSSPPVFLTDAGLFLASLFDGERTAGAIAASVALQTGATLPRSEVASLARSLDTANLLDSSAWRERQERLRVAFRAVPERPPVHAGGAYPGARDELQAFLTGLYSAPDGPGAPPGPPGGRLARGLIAPHIDLHRGGPTYAWTYRALAECQRADVYLLLGTCHLPMGTPIAALRKSYATPLGPAPVDQAFLRHLEANYDADLYADEFSHRGEHSLEFQALYLRYLDCVGEGRGAIVPILCSALHQWAAPPNDPECWPGIAAALTALRKTLEQESRTICLLAGADLAHVGPQFGDPQRLDSAALDRVGQRDSEMLEIVCRGDASGFYRQVMADDDARRICGLSPIYYLLALLGPASGRVVKYSQWLDPHGQGSVTYAGVIFEE